MYKKVILMLLVLLLLASMVVSCGPAETTPAPSEAEGTSQRVVKGPNDPIKIGFSQMMLNAAWMSELKMLTERKAEELGVELVYANAENDKQKQIADVENLLSQGIDLLLLAPVDGTAAVPAIEKANEAGVPVVIGIRATPAEDIVSFVNGDDLVAGRAAADYIATMLGGKGKVVELVGPLGASPFILRSQGFNDVVATYPEIEIVGQQVADANRAKAVSVMENIMASAPEINAVFGANDEMAFGAYEALKAAGREKDVVIIGVGGTLETFEAIRDGILTADISYPTAMGPDALELGVKYLRGEDVPNRVVVPVSLITKGNVQHWLDMVGGE
jgi:ribose transport system substrate-binding protein